jgi:hypothetical protein
MNGYIPNRWCHGGRGIKPASKELLALSLAAVKQCDGFI